MAGPVALEESGGYARERNGNRLLLGIYACRGLIGEIQELRVISEQ